MASYEQAKSLLGFGVSRPTLYSLQFRGRNIVGTTDGITDREAEYIKLFCNNIEFPGLDYEQITSIGQEAMGIQRATPAGMLFGGGNRLRFSVIENSDFGVYNSLRKLFNSVSAEGGNPNRDDRAQRMEYYNNYKFNVTLMKLEHPNSDRYVPSGDNVNTAALDHGYKVVSTFLFENCFISSIGPVTFDSSNTDAMMSFNATLRFESFFHEPRAFMYGQSLPNSITNG